MLSNVRKWGCVRSIYSMICNFNCNVFYTRFQIFTSKFAIDIKIGFPWVRSDIHFWLAYRKKYWSNSYFEKRYLCSYDFRKSSNRIQAYWTSIAHFLRMCVSQLSSRLRHAVFLDLSRLINYLHPKLKRFVAANETYLLLLSCMSVIMI